MLAAAGSGADAAALADPSGPSRFWPRATMRNASSGSGRCSASASFAGAVSQRSISARVVRMTGIALGWIGATTAFGSVVRKAKRSLVVSPSLTFLTDVQRVQIPAKKASGRLSSSANQTGGREPSGRTSFSENEVNGTTQRLSTPSQRRQCGEATLRTLVTPGSELRPFSAKAGDGMPQRASASSRTLRRVAHDRARNNREICRAAAADCRSESRIGVDEVADRLLALGQRVEVAHAASLKEGAAALSMRVASRLRAAASAVTLRACPDL